MAVPYYCILRHVWCTV